MLEKKQGPRVSLDDCGATQRSDSMVCDECNQTWDVNDPNPPNCKRKRRCEAVSRMGVATCTCTSKSWRTGTIPCQRPAFESAPPEPKRTKCEAVRTQGSLAVPAVWKCERCDLEWDEAHGSRPDCSGWESDGLNGTRVFTRQLPPTALDHLQTSLNLYRQRNAIYKDNYKRVGALLLALFPGGFIPEIRTEDDSNRLNLLIDCLGKLQRYAFQFSEGGHRDSADDLIVYAAMLREVTK